LNAMNKQRVRMIAFAFEITVPIVSDKFEDVKDVTKGGCEIEIEVEPPDDGNDDELKT
jgi:hypothetical protein